MEQIQLYNTLSKYKCPNFIQNPLILESQLDITLKTSKCLSFKLIRIVRGKIFVINVTNCFYNLKESTK